ncbi:S9 family peptidase [Alistipes sp. OttesenSCG-928-B03]|nr:S9 family peptidase [Alistipes sp. OttesenSCG-928-B03]
MKRLILLMACVFVAAGAYAQERTPVTKSNYNAAERFSPIKVRQMLYSTSIRPHWLEKSNRFWYTYRTQDGQMWYIVDPDRRTKSLLFDNAQMAADLTRILKDPYDAQHLPITGIRFTEDETRFRFTVASKVEEEEEMNRETGEKKKEKKKYVFEYDIRSGKLTHLEGYKFKHLPGWGSVSPDKQTIVYAKDFNLWCMDWENYEKAMVNEKDSTIVEQQLTFDGERYFGFGSSRTNSKDEAEKERQKRHGIDIAWSPDSRNFVVMKTDERNVKDLWVIYHTARPRPTLETYRYQMPGEKEAPQYSLHIFNMESREMREIEAGVFKDQTIGVIKTNDTPKTIGDDYTIINSVWMGDDSEFFFTRMSRDLKRMDICRVDVETLTPKTLIEERFNTYLETRGLVLTDGPGSQMIHWSEEDGWAHLYMFDYDGGNKRQITSGPWHVENIIEVDPKARVIYFTAQGREKDVNPYFEFLYRVNFDGSGLKLLTPGDISHMVSMHERRNYFIDNATRPDQIPYTDLYDANGRKVMQLEKADLSRMFEAGYKLPTAIKVKAADGVTDLYGNLYVPFDLDSTKMYPIIEYVYPGPQTEGPNYFFTAPHNSMDRLAQLGFVVITVGQRGGHPSRSKWYHTYGYGNLRDYGLADQKAAAIQIADRYPFADINRVGITGHSGGGFMSTAAILQYPDFYKVAVSCAGNHDNSIYNRWWSEKHHGVKEEVSEKGDTTFKYSIANNQQLASRLKGRLLLVTGDVDNNVHPANTFVVADALIKANKRFDMLVLPGQAHSFGNMTDYYFWRMADYFSRWLIGDCEESVDIPQLRE